MIDSVENCTNTLQEEKNNKEFSLNICHLYPDLMNMYGDLGNIIALKYRAELNNISVNVENITIGENFDASRYDIVFLGGGQDFEQDIIYKDIIEQKGNEIKNAVNENLVFLCICGGYQLMGNYYETYDKKEIPGLGIIDFYTKAEDKRLIGNIVFEASFLCENKLNSMVVGFENHSGRTYLGKNIKPFGKVIFGFGNNASDKTEGAIFKNVYCSYSHGSLLPKNYRITDHLLNLAIKRKYNESIEFDTYDTSFEENARLSMIKRLNIKYQD